jgi:23S rRNA (cytidine2498-2'-O)-methyltransferase
MQYLIFIDKRFMGKARKELESLLGGRLYELKELNTDKFLAMESSINETELVKKASEAIFVNNVIPVVAVLDKKDPDSKIIETLKSCLTKDETFRLEVLHYESKSEANAKAEEVRIGRKLESMGYFANLFMPDVLVYVIFSLGKVIVGKLDKKLSTYTIDEFRRFNNTQYKVSRSEFKLREAFECFGIDINRVESALDIGAAPGGWTKVLAEHGIRTVAVDIAPLNYSVLRKFSEVEIIEDEKALNLGGKRKITHIKKSAHKIDMDALKKQKFDMLLIDANIAPLENAKLASSFSATLNRGAYLIMTIKLIDKNIDKHISEVREALKKDYSSIRLKKLPYNRMEITCFAVKR